MISNRTQADDKVNAAAGDAIASAVIAALEAAPELFELETGGAGLEVAARAPLANGLPNRARMKIFSPKAGHTLVFFFKKSQVPYSRDRYSYGGQDLRGSALEAQDLAEWIAFLTSGFHPDKRPQNLRRAFPYEIPE